MSDPYCKVQWDLDKVKRCFTILLENAFKYTEEGDTIQLELTKVNKHVVVHIEDSGMGISKKDQERIFDRFFRSGDVRAKGIEGSGIGLTIVKKLITLHHGKISIESKENIGTKVIIELPVYKIRKTSMLKVLTLKSWHLMNESL